jgi:hypothetical protein
MRFFDNLRIRTDKRKVTVFEAGKEVVASEVGFSITAVV